MKKIITYLFIGIIGLFESSVVKSSIICYTQAVNLISDIIENKTKSLEDFEKCSESDVSFIEEKIQNLAVKKLRLTAGLLIADYYINVKYKNDIGAGNNLPENFLSDNSDFKRVADYISDFMIEYMDYDSINKYIKPKEGLELFGDYMKSVHASVVLKDIESVITAYYFPELKTDTTLPLPKLRDPEGEGLQVGPQNSPEQEKQAKGKGKLRRGSKRKVRDQGNVNIRVTENEKVKKSKSQ